MPTAKSPTRRQLTNIAQKHGTPTYVYDADTIINQYHQLKNYFPWPRTKLFYAMKANFNLAILKILEKAGANIDAVSPGDVLMALKAGFSPDKVLYTANRITDEEMKLVKSKKVLFNIGSLSRLAKFGRQYPRQPVCIRFNPNVVAGANQQVRTGGENSKFGIFLRDKDEVIKIAQKYQLKIVGIHEHTGSGIPETVQMMAGIDNILAIINPHDFPHLQFVDFGGGFKVPYRPDEKSIDYQIFGREVSAKFATLCQSFGRDLDMYFEPGRYLVAEAGHFLVRVTDIKPTKDKLFAGVNSGFPQLIRPMFYGAYHHIVNLSNPQGKTKKYDVVGNICESGDCFATDRQISEIRAGDILDIQNAGAYCYSMGGFYNLRPMPAEVMIVNGKEKVITRRQSYQEFIDRIGGG